MPNQSGVWSLSQQFQARGQGLWPAPPGAPTIGTATAGAALCASITFTAPTCTGYPAGITNYTAVSTPGCLTASGASSPLVVTGLTGGTSYTFKVKANGTNGLSSAFSAASNSITAQLVTCQTYTTAGTYSWVAPAGVTSVAVLLVGGGASGGRGCVCGTQRSGGGGALAYRNNVSVTPGSSYTIIVGAGGVATSSVTPNAGGDSSAFSAVAGGANTGGSGGTVSGTYTAGYSGGNGKTATGTYRGPGGGGAAGYAGVGGDGGSNSCGTAGTAGSGGGGGGGGWGGQNFVNCDSYYQIGGRGGGVGLYGQGANGAGGAAGTTGAGGAGGPGSGGCGTSYGGGGYGGRVYIFGGSTFSPLNGGNGGSGAVRIVWAGGSRGTPSFPSTCVGA